MDDSLHFLEKINTESIPKTVIKNKKIKTRNY